MQVRHTQAHTHRHMSNVSIRWALAQGVSDHRPLDSNKEQHPFFYKTHPKMDNFQSKSQHRATAAATVAVVAAQIVVSCSSPGARAGTVREPPDL